MKKLILSILASCAVVCATAQLRTAFFSNVKLQIPIGQRWEILATEGVRFYDDYPGLRRFSSALQGTYFFNSHLRAGVSAAIIPFHEPDGEWHVRSRYWIYAQGNLTVGRVEMLLYERLQSNYYHAAGRPHRDFWRSRFRAGVPLASGRYKPWVGFEWRYSFNDARIDEWRWSLANRFRLGAHDAVEVYSHFILNAPALGWRKNLIGGADYIHRF